MTTRTDSYRMYLQIKHLGDPAVVSVESIRVTPGDDVAAPVAWNPSGEGAVLYGDVPVGRSEHTRGRARSRWSCFW